MQSTDVIINADDLGLSRRVNDRIFNLIETKRITSATLLTNGPEFLDAVARIKAYPHASFGVHLNLTEFPPLTKNPALAPLLNGDGHFKHAETATPATAKP